MGLFEHEEGKKHADDDQGLGVLRHKAISKAKSLGRGQPDETALTSFATLFRVFLMKYFRINYEFTYDELIREIAKQKCKKELKDVINSITGNILDIQYMERKPTKAEFKKMTEQLETMIDTAIPPSKEETMAEHVEKHEQKGGILEGISHVFHHDDEKPLKRGKPAPTPRKLEEQPKIEVPEKPEKPVEEPKAETPKPEVVKKVKVPRKKAPEKTGKSVSSLDKLIGRTVTIEGDVLFSSQGNLGFWYLFTDDTGSVVLRSDSRIASQKCTVKAEVRKTEHLNQIYLEAKKTMPMKK